MTTTSPPLTNHNPISDTPALDIHQDHLDVIDPDVECERLEDSPPITKTLKELNPDTGISFLKQLALDNIISFHKKDSKITYTAVIDGVEVTVTMSFVSPDSQLKLDFKAYDKKDKIKLVKYLSADRTQHEVADLLGVSQKTVSLYQNR